MQILQLGRLSSNLLLAASGSGFGLRRRLLSPSDPFHLLGQRLLKRLLILLPAFLALAEGQGLFGHLAIQARQMDHLFALSLLHLLKVAKKRHQLALANRHATGLFRRHRRNLGWVAHIGPRGGKAAMGRRIIRGAPRKR